jgi:hypothetical protein
MSGNADNVENSDCLTEVLQANVRDQRKKSYLLIQNSVFGNIDNQSNLLMNSSKIYCQELLPMIPASKLL